LFSLPMTALTSFYLTDGLFGVFKALAVMID
jgi:hypothetical protein